ncbi:ribosome-associated translation inhibitor RaiA [Kineosporia sp. NBRC 101731]|uniref:ribosome hibernation-promoting factor, HPF/YfiA family n=1 Tax=Kineosporia sp. NBRC 101731 TaxID=3032199 RepID=UPI0024A3A56A|nr:ribosome-associated translation inhibitor RaiA [Kineosporia sp. NBRC 101731]GLY28427.1 ribosomal subunit interface protein [Kineosporia sp. NBRC 101731]
MDIVITGRHVEVTDRFRRIAEEKLEKVSQLSPTAFRIDVELSHERNPRQSSNCERIEITVRDRGPVIRAEACGQDELSALDIAFGKLLERLRRVADRKKVHHGRHAPATVRGLGAPGEGGRTGAAVTQAGIALAERPIEDTAGTRNGAPTKTRDPLEDAADEIDGFAESMDWANLPEGAEALADSPVVIRTKDHEARPMTIDQALYEMELVGHDFFLFVDAACNRPSVVYRRRGWNYGVIRLAVDAEATAGAPA